MLVTAGCPRKIWYNRVCGKEVEESPGDDHAVVDVEETHHRHRGNSNTWTQQLSLQFSRISGSVWLKLESVIVVFVLNLDDQISDVGCDKLFTKLKCLHNFPGN